MIDYPVLVEKFRQKLAPIKVAAFDIDGCLTDGRVWWDGTVGFNRTTNTRDGYGLKMLMQMGIKTGVISGGNSIGVQERFQQNLKLDFAYLGDEDKRHAYLKILDQGYKDHEILYLGDEFFDLPILRRVGFSACPYESSPEVRAEVDYVCTRPAGLGCVREVIDLLRIQRGFVPSIPDFS